MGTKKAKDKAKAGAATRAKAKAQAKAEAVVKVKVENELNALRAELMEERLAHKKLQDEVGDLREGLRRSADDVEEAEHDHFMSKLVWKLQRASHRNSIRKLKHSNEALRKDAALSHDHDSRT